MYKYIKTKHHTLTFNIFPLSRKSLSIVYKTGIRIWKTFEDINYSIVLGTFRIILSKRHSISQTNEES
jgi:hypothetical protein